MLPNIVFITCHDLGKHLGCYGQETVHSESLDALAQQGVILDNSFCTAPQCTPSRAALHTGRHAHSVGVLGLAHSPFDWRLHPNQMHAARRLREAGYNTALIGVQHVTRNRDTYALGYDRVSPVEPAPRIAERAGAFLRDVANSDEPFYLEIGFFEPHRPYDWGGTTPDSSKGVRLPPYVPDSPAATSDFAALQGAIRTMDQAVGKILTAIEVNGLAEDTFVIFTTDHGVAMPRAKCTLYDPGIGTSLVMRWPARGISGGRRFNELISHVDVLPTLLEGIELAVPDDLHGKSFWPLLQGQPYEPNREIFAEKTYHTAYEPMRGIRTRTHKLILNLDVGPGFDVPADIRQSPIYPSIIDQVVVERDYIELYDLEQDPNETVNLAGRPELAEVEKELRKRMSQWMSQTNDPILQGPVPSPFFETAIRLLDIPS
ncbi:MAG: sulfatase [Chloroflexota bacterium]|nr:sulfatase [Chloroflexota bacterium]